LKNLDLLGGMNVCIVKIKAIHKENMIKFNCFECHFHTCDPDFGVEGCKIHLNKYFTNKKYKKSGCNQFIQAGFWRKIFQLFGD
jgi:hypothetical protein